MKYTMESDFAKHVKSSGQHNVYLLYGGQAYLIALYEKMIVKKALGGADEAFNLRRFDGDTLDLQTFYDAVESVPLMAAGCCVTLSLDPEKLDMGRMKELCAVIGDPPQTTVIVVTVKEPPARREKMNLLIKACDKAGCVVELGSRRGADTLRFLRDRAQKNGCTFESGEASYMVERCTDDLQLLATELDKLCAYASGRKITRADIDAVVTVVLQARVFDLSKAILRGNFPKAMELISQLDDLREPAARTLSILSGAFVDLYRGFAARQANVPAGRAAPELGYAKNREFAIKNGMSDSGAYTAGQLGAMLEALAEADLRVKSSGGDDRVVLEETVAKLFLIGGRQKC